MPRPIKVVATNMNELVPVQIKVPFAFKMEILKRTKEANRRLSDVVKQALQEYMDNHPVK